MSRDFSPYEETQLIRAGIDPHSIAAEEQTPVEYLTGSVDFMGRRFSLTRDVLIPRVETEELVWLGMAILQRKLSKRAQSPQALPEASESTTSNKALTVADVGCGAGVIGLSLLLEWQKKKRAAPQLPALELWASDISEAAMTVAQSNADELLSPAERHSAHFLHSDLLREYAPELSFDLILANLPYIPSSRIPTLDVGVKDFEPWLALDGGPDGLTLIGAFLKQAVLRLRPRGRIILEIDYTHSEAELRALLPEDYTVSIHFDSFERSRFAIIQGSYSD